MSGKGVFAKWTGGMGDLTAVQESGCRAEGRYGVLKTGKGSLSPNKLLLRVGIGVA